MDAIKIEKKYTYANYVKWDDDVRYELIDGVPFMMSSPKYAHQSISGELFFQIRIFLSDKPCKVLNAPFDVRLNAPVHVLDGLKINLSAVFNTAV